MIMVMFWDNSMSKTRVHFGIICLRMDVHATCMHVPTNIVFLLKLENKIQFFKM